MPNQAQALADQWNARIAVGDAVEYRSFPDAEPEVFVTRTPAEVMSGHAAVLWLEGKSGCVSVDACRKVTLPKPTLGPKLNPTPEVSAYSLPDGSTIERCLQRDGSYKWAVRHNGSCLAKDGWFEFEPSPSSRDDDFMARCRFDDAEAAYASWLSKKEP